MQIYKGLIDSIIFAKQNVLRNLNYLITVYTKIGGVIFMKNGNLALSLSILLSLILFVAFLFYSGKGNIGAMRSQIGLELSATDIPSEVNSIAVNRIKPTVNDLAVNKFKPTVNSAESLVAYDY